MIRLRSALAIAALLLASSSAAAANKPLVWPTGLYSNVFMSGVTGDLGGMEARFYEEAGKHMVEFVWCQGWCNQAFKAELTRGDGGFTFQYVEIYQSSDGPIEANLNYVVQLSGKSKIKIYAYEGGEPRNEGKPQTLKRAKRLFGIDVVNTNGQQDN